MLKKLLSFAAALLVVAGCYFDEDYYIDFDQTQGYPGMFKATSTQVTDLSQGLPDYTSMPDGTPVNEFIKKNLDTKATSNDVAGFLRGFLTWEEKGKVIEISGTYQSVDDFGEPITLSGKVIIPTKVPVKRVILLSHYTIGSNAEAPSNTFPLEGQLAQLGYAIVAPDYLGYGVTNNHYHPYLMMELSATNVIDMYRAVKPFLKAIGYAPEHEDIYLMGFSQGGGTTMAVQYVLERDYGPTSKEPISIKRNFAGGGIYDIKATFESFVENNLASYPCGVPFVIVGQVKGNHLDDSYITKMLQPEVASHVEEWFLEKKCRTGQMNAIINTHQTDKILTPLGMDRTSDEISVLYQYMTLNSVLSLAWSPKAPVYMLHSIDDDTVPYENAARAKVRWAGSNIQYNFGHYGTHQICCLRFIYTVKNILKDED